MHPQKEPLKQRQGGYVAAPSRAAPRAEHMVMIHDFLAHYRLLVTKMQDDLKSFESGYRRMGELRNGRHVDITDDWIRELKHRIANLEQIIVAYERRIT
jgi:hypothetical protein